MVNSELWKYDFLELRDGLTAFFSVGASEVRHRVILIIKRPIKNLSIRKASPRFWIHLIGRAHAREDKSFHVL